MKCLVGNIALMFVLVQITPAQTVAAKADDAEGQEVLAVAVKLSRPSLAYQAEAIQKFLGEANFLSERLKLPTHHPIKSSDINVHVTAPWFSKTDSPNTNLTRAERIRAATFFASGVIESGNFSFAVGGPENQVYVHRFKIKNEDSIFDLYPALAKAPCLIDTNGAYQLATQWLSAISVDVSGLERKHKLSVFQWFFWGKPEDLPKDHWTYHEPITTNKTMLPIFDVKWGDDGHNARGAKVTILGSTKELMELQIGDASFYKRPPLAITNAFELNTRPDPPIKRLQRSVNPSQTNSVLTGSNNPTPSLPPPFRQRVKRQ